MVAWIVVFMLAPVSAVYYPVSVLPVWLQPVSLALPSAHVFEGMRALVFEGVLRWDHLAWAVGLNVVYMAGGIAVFLYAFHQARVRGALLQTGE